MKFILPKNLTMTAQEFIYKMLELGSGWELSCSDNESQLYLKEARKLYDNYIREINNYPLTPQECFKVEFRFPIGMNLFTKDGRRIGNAIVVGHEKEYTIIKTDFGNSARLAEVEINELFHIKKTE